MSFAFGALRGRTYRFVWRAVSPDDCGLHDSAYFELTRPTHLPRVPSFCDAVVKSERCKRKQVERDVMGRHEWDSLCMSWPEMSAAAGSDYDDYTFKRS